MNNDNVDKLISNFKIIANKRWIKGVNNFNNSVGLTFEYMLNKKADSLFFPDYNGIEIKCTQRYSGYSIGLLSMSFTGPDFYEMNKLVKKYGIFDEKYKMKKILMAKLKVNKKVLINDKYYFELKIDRLNNKLYLLIYDINYCFLEEGPYINLQCLADRINIKLNILAIIWASKKNIDNHRYFRYYKISIYEFKGFNVFIDLLESNLIDVSILGRVSRSGNEEGRQRNKGLVFYIPKKNIELLFKKNITYNNDEKNDNNFIINYI